MEKESFFLDIISNLLELLSKLGVGQDLLEGFSFWLLVLTILIAVFKLSRDIVNFYQKKRLYKITTKQLAPFFYPEELINARRYFIPTKAQDFTTETHEDVNRRFAWIERYPLIRRLLKKGLTEPTYTTNRTHKYYMILADSGMGKSTFMLNLYLKYKGHIIKDRYGPMHLFPLGHPDCLNAVEGIAEKQKSIVLLDALDEDIAAIENYSERIKTIITATREFRKVIITCRTQFFLNEDEEPSTTGLLKYGPEGGEIYFRKIYISPFNSSEVTRYILKRFPLYNPFNWKNFFKAKKIAGNSPDLVSRPMILSFIQELITEKKDYNFLYQIYEVIIRKWIERESRKPTVRQYFKNNQEFQNQLYSFSRKLAINIYQNRKSRGGLFIDGRDPLLLNPIIDAIAIRTQKIESVRSFKFGRSLLNRNASGQYRFAHRSILEYLLAVEAYENSEFYKSLDLSDDSFAFINKFLPEMELGNSIV